VECDYQNTVTPIEAFLLLRIISADITPGQRRRASTLVGAKVDAILPERLDEAMDLGPKPFRPKPGNHVLSDEHVFVSDRSGTLA
jgi:hypothetical protein